MSRFEPLSMGSLLSLSFVIIEQRRTSGGKKGCASDFFAKKKQEPVGKLP